MTIFKTSLLIDLLSESKDGEWGEASYLPDYRLMGVIRGADFESCRLGNMENLPRRFIPTRISERKELRTNDIVIETAGGTADRPTGRTLLIKDSLINQSEIPLICASFSRFLRPDESKVYAPYLYWYLQYLYHSGQMDVHQIQHTGVARFQYTDFSKSTLIPIPSIQIQTRIAEILSSLDDTIELNRRMNETLEQMAMALYKHWFIDFGPFPDGEFIDSELGLIPKEWEVVNIGSAVQILGGGTPSTKIKEYWEYGTINWFSPTDLTAARSLFIEKSSKKITKFGLDNSSARLFPPQSIMMTSRATIGEIAINRSEACTNQGFITLIPNESFSLYQIYGWLRFNRDAILSIANGSTFLEVSKSNFKSLKITKPYGIEKYLNISHNIFAQIDSLISENKLLIETRDYLLPRLLSGEINLDIVEDHVQEVMSDVNTPVRV